VISKGLKRTSTKLFIDLDSSVRNLIEAACLAQQGETVELEVRFQAVTEETQPTILRLIG
jgi:hypothetical protein